MYTIRRCWHVLWAWHCLSRPTYSMSHSQCNGTLLTSLSAEWMNKWRGLIYWVLLWTVLERGIKQLYANRLIRQKYKSDNPGRCVYRPIVGYMTFMILSASHTTYLCKNALWSRDIELLLWLLAKSQLTGSHSAHYNIRPYMSFRRQHF